MQRAEYKIRGQILNLDIREELEPYIDKFERQKIRGEKLQACSPFRYEKNPSFAVNLDNGLWVDSGADTEAGRKGNFITLLSHFRQEPIMLTMDYLCEKYGHELDEVQKLQLDMSFLSFESVAPAQQSVQRETYINDLNKPNLYLLDRGISKEVQEQFNIGSTEVAVVFAWHDYKGNVINCKYRNMLSKTFWYLENGQSIKQHLYGFHKVLESVSAGTVKRLWITEGETDALTLWGAGECAVALGCASLSEQQKQLLFKLPNDISIVLATDNDTVGIRCAYSIYKELGGYFNLYAPVFPKNIKDINELSKEQLTNLIQNIRPCKACNLVGV